MRKRYEMTEEDLKKILAASRPVPMIMLQCGMPPSPQETVNGAWAELGRRMGFYSATVEPDYMGGGDRFFTAEPIEKED